jgi:hypothetical protein
MKEQKIDFSSSHFTLSRKSFSGILKMPNILNQFQNKGTTTEEQRNERDEEENKKNVNNFSKGPCCIV